MNCRNNTETDDVYIRQLQKSIRSIKEDREMEREFMTTWAWKAYMDDMSEAAIKKGRENSVFSRIKKAISVLFG